MAMLLMLRGGESPTPLYEYHGLMHRTGTLASMFHNSHTFTQAALKHRASYTYMTPFPSWRMASTSLTYPRQRTPRIYVEAQHRTQPGRAYVSHRTLACEPPITQHSHRTTTGPSSLFSGRHWLCLPGLAIYVTA
ncbi:hypothetical protein GDO81_006274 [Engystomops pustulosus]|uniref:Uncharacterized protein n=1 Tax=Engystomops pustulosus TaxID=76066 RepID=A0AAV7CW09_ENGPU|nr:hypothetical protein GDO81_006274 [Engystomops pustulosus]